ncbi:MAG: hydrogenase maturation nickel metallochaperone HypA [Candidatus Firestonebacteria bacterium]
MHELSLATSIAGILRKECRKNGIKKLKVVRLKVGVLRNVVSELLKDAFKGFGGEELFEDVKIRVQSIKLKLKCADCSNEIIIKTPENIVLKCAKCGKKEMKILAGNELIISGIEGD